MLDRLPRRDLSKVSAIGKAASVGGDGDGGDEFLVFILSHSPRLSKHMIKYIK